MCTVAQRIRFEGRLQTLGEADQHRVVWLEVVPLSPIHALETKPAARHLGSKEIGHGLAQEPCRLPTADAAAGHMTS